MIALPTYSGHTAVFGLGRSGLAAIAALRAAGNHVLAWDDNEAARMVAAQHGAELHNPLDDFGTAQRLVVSPGVPLTHPAPHPVVKAAKAAKAEIIGDMDLFHDALVHAGVRDTVTIIGITGTNGKSTTTALIGHMLRHAGHQVEMGGNIGTPVLDLPISEGMVYVLELSSYQLDLNRRFAADIGVWLNITPDHLDRHGDIDGYVKAKANLFAASKCARRKIIAIDDAPSLALAESLSGAVTRLGIKGDVDISYTTGEISAADKRVDLVGCAALRGLHNAQNAAAAFAVGQELGIAAGAMQAAFESFNGMPHRMQTVGTYAGVTFVNDSKATNVEAARHALAAFENIYWIAGGRAKADAEGRLGLDMLAPHYDNIRKAYLIGEAAQAFAGELPSSMSTQLAASLGDAVCAAADQAQSDAIDKPVVLLSPACASFDQFPDFEARGDAFCDAVSGWKAGAR